MRLRRGPALPLLALLGLVLIDLAPAEAAEQTAWQDLLQRASAGSATPHSGEVLWVQWEGEQSTAGMAEVVSTDGVVRLIGPGSRTLQVSPEGGWITDGADGTDRPLPPSRPSTLSPLVLAGKYDVDVVRDEPLLDRVATLLELRRRADARLRERLWLDRESGLVLRRESYDGERMLRMFAYLTLTMPAGEPLASQVPTLDRGRTPPLHRVVTREGGPENALARRLAKVRREGFQAPERLPGNYVANGMFGGAREGSPLQLVYDDGLYAVSLFQQQGSTDWDALPEGGEPVPELGERAVHWPGAVPSRLVWEARGITYTLVGDAPPDEFMAIATALPHDEPEQITRRIRKGLSRLWSLMSPWP